jgi:hypothetical protein
MIGLTYIDDRKMIYQINSGIGENKNDKFNPVRYLKKNLLNLSPLFDIMVGWVGVALTGYWENRVKYHSDSIWYSIGGGYLISYGDHSKKISIS